METRTERGKGKKGDACLNLAMTKRQDSVGGRDVPFPFSLFPSFLFFLFFFFSLSCTTFFWASWNVLLGVQLLVQLGFYVVFQPELGIGMDVQDFDFLEYD